MLTLLSKFTLFYVWEGGLWSRKIKWGVKPVPGLLFSASDTLLAVGVPALRIISITFVLSSLTTVLGYSASGLGNGTINMLGTALRQFIIYVPATWVLAEFGNMNLIWYASWIAEICALGYSAVSVRRLYERVVKIEREED